MSRAAPRSTHFRWTGLVFGVSAIYRETQRRGDTAGSNTIGQQLYAGNRSRKPEGRRNRELRTLPFLPTEVRLSNFYQDVACQRGILRQKGNFFYLLFLLLLKDIEVTLYSQSINCQDDGNKL